MAKFFFVFSFFRVFVMRILLFPSQIDTDQFPLLIAQIDLAIGGTIERAGRGAGGRSLIEKHVARRLDCEARKRSRRQTGNERRALNPVSFSESFARNLSTNSLGSGP